MAALLMAKEKAAGSEANADGTTSLRVNKPAARLVGKVANHRELSVAELFEQQDVQTFFTHLLIEEMRKETERLQGGKAPEGKPAKGK